MSAEAAAARFALHGDLLDFVGAEAWVTSCQSW